MKILDEITVQVTLDSEDLEALRKHFEIGNKEEACAAIRECISFYVAEHKESVSSLSGFVSSLCEFHTKKSMTSVSTKLNKKEKVI